MKKFVMLVTEQAQVVGCIEPTLADLNDMMDLKPAPLLAPPAVLAYMCAAHAISKHDGVLCRRTYRVTAWFRDFRIS